jgi:hypothetical protein
VRGKSVLLAHLGDPLFADLILHFAWLQFTSFLRAALAAKMEPQAVAKIGKDLAAALENTQSPSLPRCSGPRTLSRVGLRGRECVRRLRIVAETYSNVGRAYD